MDTANLVSQLNVAVTPGGAPGASAMPLSPALPPSPDTAVVNRFERVLAGGASRDDLAGPGDLDLDARLGADAVNGTGRSSQHFFDALLGAAESLSSGLGKSWAAVSTINPAAGVEPDAMGSTMPSIQKMLEHQREMVDFAMKFETIGKGTAKFIDNTNQLVKMS